MKQPLVSIVIAARNSGKYLATCFEHIKSQTYSSIEIIVVDSHSSDNTTEVCKKSHVTLLQFDNSQLQGRFDATYKRNMGAEFARGQFVYYVDADFELSPHVVEQCVTACIEGKYDGVIVREFPYGNGFWTACKALEQDLIAGDDNVEAPRFFKKTVWTALAGLDASLGAGCDDWDLYVRFREHGYRATRINAPVRHNEGRITIRGAFKKGTFYGKDVHKFIKKNPKGGVIYFFPIRLSYIRNWRLLASHPLLTLGIIIMRAVEYLGGAYGILLNTASGYGIRLASS